MARTKAHGVNPGSPAGRNRRSERDALTIPAAAINPSTAPVAQPRGAAIAHLLGQIAYEDLTPEPIVLPPRQKDTGYVRPPMSDQTFIPEPF